MNQFDVIVVGAGPAGLECARILQNTPLSVLLLERKQVIGPKPCAGGIVESVEDFDLPVDRAQAVFEHGFRIGGHTHFLRTRRPVRIVDRWELGQHQLRPLKASGNITVLTHTNVRRIDGNCIKTTGGDFFFHYLVGADGATSLVRRHLRLESRYTIGMYYDIPQIRDRLLLVIDGPTLGTGYIWEFPHRTFTNVGIYFDPFHWRTRQAREALDAHMNQKRYPMDPKTFRAFPIMYRYQGCKFQDNIFLAGEAAGLTSKLTGEGISFAIISGREVARKILNPGYAMNSLKRILQRKRQQEKLLALFQKIPLGLNLCYTLSFLAFKHGLTPFKR